MSENGNGKVRSLLTVIGITIGIATSALILAYGYGAVCTRLITTERDIVTQIGVNVRQDNDMKEMKKEQTELYQDIKSKLDILQTNTRWMMSKMKMDNP